MDCKQFKSYFQASLPPHIAIISNSEFEKNRDDYLVSKFSCNNLVWSEFEKLFAWVDLMLFDEQTEQLNNLYVNMITIIF